MLNAAEHSMGCECECEAGMVTLIAGNEEVLIPRVVWEKVEARATQQGVSVSELIWGKVVEMHAAGRFSVRH